MRRKPNTAAGSSQRAVELDHLEQAIGDGPCITALREMSPGIVEDVASDFRWPELNRKFAATGVKSSLGIPLEISGDARAALNFFASEPGALTANVYDKAVGFAAAAHNTLVLSVRINTAQHRAEDLEVALQTRTAINLACGVVMAQNRCSQAEAMDILAKVSSNRNRNRKLRDVATELIEQLSGGSIQTHFEAQQEPVGSEALQLQQRCGFADLDPFCSLKAEWGRVSGDVVSGSRTDDSGVF